MLTAAAVLMALHAVLSLLGFVTLVLTEDVYSGRATKALYRTAVAATAVVTGIGAQRVFSGHGTEVLVAAVILSFATSGLVAFAGRRDGGYRLPALFTILPAVSLVLVLLGQLPL